MKLDDKEDIKNQQKKAIDTLSRVVSDIAWAESVDTKGYCRPETMHAIMHLNEAKSEISLCIKILEGKYATHSERKDV